jgi:uncharacterized protein
MSGETIDLCLDLVDRYVANKTGTIRFYGGEPLLAFDGLRYFVDRAKTRGLNLRYTAMSNGTVVDREVVDYCKAHRIHVQRSIDGCAESQIRTRGAKSLELYRIGTDLYGDRKFTRRMTVTPESAGEILKSLRYLNEEMGFKKGVSPTPDYSADWTEEAQKTYCDQLWEIGKEFVKDFKKGKPFYVYFFAREAASRFASLGTAMGCGAGRGLHAVSWDGYLFPCHRFCSEARDGSFCAGHITDLLSDQTRDYGKEIQARREQINTKRWPDRCANCIAQYGCDKGGCVHINYKCTGNPETPPEFYCRIRRESAKIVTWIDNQLRHIDAFWFTRGNTRIEARRYAENHARDKEPVR